MTKKKIKELENSINAIAEALTGHNSLDMWFYNELNYPVDLRIDNINEKISMVAEHLGLEFKNIKKHTELVEKQKDE